MIDMSGFDWGRAQIGRVLVGVLGGALMLNSCGGSTPNGAQPQVSTTSTTSAPPSTIDPSLAGRYALTVGSAASQLNASLQKVEAALNDETQSMNSLRPGISGPAFSAWLARSQADLASAHDGFLAMLPTLDLLKSQLLGLDVPPLLQPGLQGVVGGVTQVDADVAGSGSLPVASSLQRVTGDMIRLSTAESHL
jgi:hypothetical protein